MDEHAALAKSRLRAMLFSETPEQLGRYEIVEQLGTGAMGAVYRARDPQLEREVALKILLPGTESEVALERFSREAQALARLAHPNVVQIFEVGGTADERFIAMELVEGGTLADWLKQEKRSVGEIVDVFVALAEGLHAAHAAGVIHRDFKPKNVLVGSDNRPRITDFGLALGDRDVAPSMPDETGPTDLLSQSLTEDGHVVGTPPYMAPEQFTGGDVDARADQWSFCVTLFEALYGERPFRAKTLPGLIHAVARGVPKRPAGVSVPRRIERVLARGLSVDPAERFRSMRDLGRTLARARRSKKGVLAAVVVLGGVVALGAVALRPRGGRCEPTKAVVARVWNADVQAGIAERGREPLDRFFSDWAAARDEVCKAVRQEPGQRAHDDMFACLHRQQAAAQVVLQLLGSEEPAEVHGGLSSAARLPDPRACTRADALKSRPPPEIADAVESLYEELERVRSLAAGGKVAQARALADDAAARAEALGYEPVLARALLEQGVLAEERTSDLVGEPLIERAYSLARGSGDDDLAFEAAVETACLVGALGRRFEDGEAWLKAARSLSPSRGAWRADECEARLRLMRKARETTVELRRRALAGAEAELGERAPDVGRLRVALSVDLDALGETQEATAHREAGTRILLDRLGPDHPALAFAHYARAKSLLRVGDHEAAVEIMRDAVRLDKARDGALTIEAADRLQGLGVVLAQQGEYTEARVYLETVLGFFDAVLEPDDQRIGILLANLGRLVALLGDMQKAQEYAERAVIVAEARTGDSPTLMVARSQLAAVLNDAGKHERAVKEARLALEMDVDVDWRRVSLRQTLAAGLIGLGRLDEALRELEYGSEQAKTLLGAHPHTASLLANRGEVLSELGRHDEADAVLREALAMIEQTQGADHYEISRVTYILSGNERRRGRPQAAVEWAKRTLAIREAVGQNQVELAHAYFDLARALKLAGRDGAQAPAERARALYDAAGSEPGVARVDALVGR